MSVLVSFMTPKATGIGPVTGIGDVRTTETLELGGTTTAQAAANEIVIVANEEAATILVAFGKTPDAAATTETSNTTAGFPVAAGQVSPPIITTKGDKIAVAAVA